MSAKTPAEPLFSDEKIEAHSKAMTIGMSDDNFRGFRYGMYQMRVPYEADRSKLLARIAEKEKVLIKVTAIATSCFADSVIVGEVKAMDGYAVRASEMAKEEVDRLKTRIAELENNSDSAFPSAEDVKRWHQLLVGYSEGAMIADMLKTHPYTKRIRSLREAAQVAVDALAGSVWPNAISADELALLAMNNAGSQKSIDSARSIANDHRASQEASRAALSILAEIGVTPTEK